MSYPVWGQVLLSRLGQIYAVINVLEVKCACGKCRIGGNGSEVMWVGGGRELFLIVFCLPFLTLYGRSLWKMGQND